MKNYLCTLLLGFMLSSNVLAQTIIVGKDRTVTTIYPPAIPICGSGQSWQPQQPLPNVTVYPPVACVPYNPNMGNNGGYYTPMAPLIPGQIYPTPQPMTPVEALGYSLGVAIGIRH